MVTNHFKLEGTLPLHASSHLFAICVQMKTGDFHFVYDYTLKRLLVKRGMF